MLNKNLKTSFDIYKLYIFIEIYNKNYKYNKLHKSLYLNFFNKIHFFKLSIYKESVSYMFYNL